MSAERARDVGPAPGYGALVESPICIHPGTVIVYNNNTGESDTGCSKESASIVGVLRWLNSWGCRFTHCEPILEDINYSTTTLTETRSSRRGV
jgi:hypothetical protein